MGQAAGGQQDKQQEKPKPPGDARHQEIVRLIEEGQLKLRDAVTLAEKETRGAAIEVRCNIQPVAASDSEKEKARGPQANASKQLVYEIVCYANRQMTTVHVNGLTRKVTPADGDEASRG